jgi:tripartite-type tricarboxylate transporter receptor subunit TctC
MTGVSIKNAVRSAGGMDVVQRYCAIALTLWFGAGANGVLAQQDYPNRPIRMLVGVVPGGATDILARIFGQKMTEAWQQQVVIDNRPGANQIIAAEMTAKAAPDGYTLQMVPAGFAINPAMHPKLPYDPIRDFTAVSMVAMVPNVMVVHPSIPVKSVSEFVVYARARPGQLSYGSSGVGSPSHLCGELLDALARIQMTHVPYKGQGAAIIDLLGGHLKVAFPSIPASIPHLKTGRLVALGVTTHKRSSALPDVPTIAESGVKDYEVSGWYGVIAPPKMSKPLLAKLNGELNRILNTPEVHKTMSTQGADPLGSTSEEFAAAIATDIPKWKKIVKEAGIKVE